jgi:hypothetical protein
MDGLLLLLEASCLDAAIKQSSSVTQAALAAVTKVLVRPLFAPPLAHVHVHVVVIV